MTFWDVFWLMVWGFLFICYLMVIFQVIVDIIRDRTMKGWGRALWLIALLIAPPLTALIYVIARGGGMAQREQAAVRESQAATDDYIRSVAGATDPTEQIARAKQLLDAGAITTPEFEQLKAKALA
ncbi:MAG TPA: SHOCT domain-containing protein [Arachnia sp.]|nr:SHOCT domain-containing protein [Arachnia sp.]HMT86503.1 SHOCT domain-containing protein [Arachnia sp.]